MAAASQVLVLFLNPWDSRSGKDALFCDTADILLKVEIEGVLSSPHEAEKRKGRRHQWEIHIDAQARYLSGRRWDDGIFRLEHSILS
jgi:hypothetical protein